MNNFSVDFFIFLILLPAIIIAFEFFGFLLAGKHLVNKILLKITEVISLIIFPGIYLLNGGKENDCCGDSAVFSPGHQLTMAVIIVLCLVAYFYSSYRKRIATPVIEVLVNCLLIISIVLNVFIAIQTKTLLVAIIGNVPVILLMLLALIKSHQLFIDYATEMHTYKKNRFEMIAWKILRLKPVMKFPVILVLCLPILIMLITILLLFGQKPDSIIRAFTDTYKQGFSQWDYKCDNVDCGGHYLCSVAANGHKNIVKPKRLGVRNGGNIVCNRQLLVSNAFKDLLQEKFPAAHKVIRINYNTVGDLIHKYYYIFNNKFLADFIYILMKPLEWFFILVLYTFDRNPENRIATQYLSNTDRKALADVISNSTIR
jgi:hypothetical protein